VSFPNPLQSNPLFPYGQRIHMHPCFGCSSQPYIEIFNFLECDNLCLCVRSVYTSQKTTAEGSYLCLEKSITRCSMCYTQDHHLVSIVYWLSRRPHPFLTHDDLKPVNHTYMTFHLDDHCLLAICLQPEGTAVSAGHHSGPCGEVGCLGIHRPLLASLTSKSWSSPSRNTAA